jgi:hypothetical protein
MRDRYSGLRVDPDRRCEAVTEDGAPCPRPPVSGSRLCAFHGGHAAERRAERERLLEEDRERSGEDGDPWTGELWPDRKPPAAR